MPRNRKKKSANTGKIVFWTTSAFIVAMVVFLGARYGMRTLAADRAKSLFDELYGVYQASLYVEENATATLNDPTSTFPANYLERFRDLYIKNKDVAGWLSINNAGVNFPIVQGEDNDYYKTHNFLGKQEGYGTPYFDFETALEESETPTNKIVWLDGDADGTIASELRKYLDIAYYRRNPTIELATVYEAGEYKVISAFITNSLEQHGEVFNYSDYHTFLNEEEFKFYISEIRKRSAFDTRVDLTFGDDLVTISAPVADFDGARLIIVARKIRTNETEFDEANTASPNQYALQCDEWYRIYGGQKPAEEQMLSVNDVIDGANDHHGGSDSSFMENPPPPYTEDTSSETSSEGTSSEEPSSSEASSEEPSSSETSSEEPSSSEASSEEPSSSETSSETSSEVSSRPSSSKPSSNDTSSTVSYIVWGPSSEDTSSNTTTSNTSSTDSTETSSETSSRPSSRPSSNTSSTISYEDWSPSSSNTSSRPTSSETSSDTSSTPPASSEDTSSEEPSNSLANRILSVYENGILVEDTAYDIVCQIVANEMNDSCPDEALKAQAVAAHTFVVFHNNMNWIPDVGLRTPSTRIKNLVREVIEEMVYYNGKPIYAAYFSTSAGYTNTAGEVWGGTNYPYTQTVESKYDYLVPNYEVVTKYTYQSVRDIIKSKLGITLTGDPTNWFEVVLKTNAGYNSLVSVGGQTTYTKSNGTTAQITGTVLRSVFGLRSNHFEIVYNNADGQTFKITTRGYGHGVGMSQYGAIQYAKIEGWDYKQILTHYYTGVEVR